MIMLGDDDDDDHFFAAACFVSDFLRASFDP
jgi:hypothetical protein